MKEITNLNETIEMMNSTDFKERFRAEYYQLEIRTTGLKKMMTQYKNGELKFEPKSSYEMFYNQYISMVDYLKALKDRAEVEGIEL